jgi:hypothetical protein
VVAPDRSRGKAGHTGPLPGILDAVLQMFEATSGEAAPTLVAAATAQPRTLAAGVAQWCPDRFPRVVDCSVMTFGLEVDIAGLDNSPPGD